jgi:hypothetical protein
MKRSLVACAALCCTLAWAGPPPAAAPSLPPTGTLKGEVLEVQQVETYTYLRLKTADGETWAAVARSPLKKGAQVTIENAMVMKDFQSKSLNRTFPAIVFGDLVVPGGVQPMSGDVAAAHAGLAKPADVGDVKVAKATGPNARTVADIVTKSAELKDKPVVVRGKVVKYNPEIMDRNWVHIRDGSGVAADGSNDVLVTTKSQAKVGDVVLVKGVVHTNKDFGAGYSYKVLIEDATLEK